MKFIEGASISGPLVLGYENDWHRQKVEVNDEKGQRIYDKGVDFFWVHWEISKDKPLDVKLHVECPRVTVDSELNLLKKEMVNEFLAIHFKTLVEESGYIYISGSRVKSEQIEKHKSTQAFRVVLTEQQKQSEHRANIEMVNAVMSEAVGEVVQRFAARLQPHFQS